MGIETGPGEGAVWSLESRWPLPPWATLLLAVAAAAFVVGIYLREAPTVSLRRRMALAAIRLALLALACAMLAQVSLGVRRTGLPYVGVLVDDSASMGIVDRYDADRQAAIARRVEKAIGPTAPPSRWNLARTLLAERRGALVERLRTDYKPRLHLLSDLRRIEGDSTEAILGQLSGIQPQGPATRLGAGALALLDQLRGSAPAGVILLTDGINTDGPSLAEAAAVAARRGVPLLLVGLGSDQPVRDLELTDLLVDDVVFLGDVVSFEARLSATGFQGSRVAIVLRQADQGEVLARAEVTIGADGEPQSVRVPYRPTAAGRFEFVLEAIAQDDELQKENNVTAKRRVEVRNDKIRVLLVHAYPNYEFRFLRNMLGRDETIELATVLQQADPGYAEQDAAALRVFPVGREELFSYDVIVLGDANPALLSPTAIQNIADFVDQPGKGGAVVLLAGPRYMPSAWRETALEKLMPFPPDAVRLSDPDTPIERGFLVAPTEQGLALPAMQLGDTSAETAHIWRELPPLYWFAEIGSLRPGARVLAENPDRLMADGRPCPIFILQYVGAGKVLFHATDETWRWRYRAGDVYFARYWVQMLRFLARSKLIEQGRSATLSTDQSEYRLGESVRLRARFADDREAPAEDDGVTVVVEQPGGRSRRVVLRRSGNLRGTFEGDLSNLPTGNYHAWMAIPAVDRRATAVDFAVKPPAGEFERVRMDADAMRQAAKLSGGAFYTFEQASRLLERLPSGRQVPIETLPPKPLWNRPPVILLFLALLIAEWILRKLGGMV